MPCFRALGSSLMRMRVGSRRMFVSKLAVFMSRSCVLLGLFVLANRVMMLGLMMMVRSGVVMGSCMMMMLLRGMFG